MTAAELSDSLQVLQDMLDAWDAERLMIYVVQRIVNNQNGFRPLKAFRHDGKLPTGTALPLILITGGRKCHYMAVRESALA